MQDKFQRIRDRATSKKRTDYESLRHEVFRMMLDLHQPYSEIFGCEYQIEFTKKELADKYGMIIIRQKGMGRVAYLECLKELHEYDQEQKKQMEKSKRKR